MNAEISVVILCYRAGERIRDFVDRVISLVSNSVPAWEIVLVGNYVKGSDDNTPDIIKDIASKNKNIKIVAMEKAGMMGWDARTGLEKAAGKYVCLIDGDEQMPPEDILRVYEKIKEEGLDLVKTYRVVRYDGIARRFISASYNMIFNMLFPGAYVKDVNSKPKIFRKQAYDRLALRSDDWFLDAEMIIQAKKLKLKIGEVPTEFYKNKYRKSFVRFDTIFEFIKNLIRAKFGGNK